MADLKVDYQLLDSIERSLSSLHSEFQNIQVNTSAYDGASVAKSLAGIAGISAAASGIAGISATVLNGWELDAGDWQGTAYIPPLHNWFYTHLEVPMGASVGG